MTGESVKKVAVFSHTGKGNLGDDATLGTVIHNVRLLNPGADICAFTLNPADTQARFQVLAFPIRRLGRAASAPVPGACAGMATQTPPVGVAGRVKQAVKQVPVLGNTLRSLWRGLAAIPATVASLAFLVTASRRLKGADLFIVAGGGQLGDYFGGAWGFPFTILQWCLLARARGARVVFLSVGAGPLQTFLGRRFCRWALLLADYRSFRDEGSRALIESLGVGSDNSVFPDLVHGFHAGAPRGGVHAGPCVVGINPLPFHDPRYWAEDSADVYGHYVQTLATFAAQLVNAGHKVLLFPTQIYADPPVIHDVATRVRELLGHGADAALLCPPVANFDDLFAAINRTDLVVASRFHGIVLSCLLGRPVIGLSYNQKTDELMTDLGQGEFVRDIGRIDALWLLERFERLHAQCDGARRRIEARQATYRLALDRQYALVLGGATVLEPRMAPQTA